MVDLAYMLTTGGPLEVSAEGEIVRVAVPEQLVFERESRSEGDCVKLDLELRWSSGAGSPEIYLEPVRRLSAAYGMTFAAGEVFGRRTYAGSFDGARMPVQAVQVPPERERIAVRDTVRDREGGWSYF